MLCLHCVHSPPLRRYFVSSRNIMPPHPVTWRAYNRPRYGGRVSGCACRKFRLVSAPAILLAYCFGAWFKRMYWFCEISNFVTLRIVEVHIYRTTNTEICSVSWDTNRKLHLPARSKIPFSVNSNGTAHFSIFQSTRQYQSPTPHRHGYQIVMMEC